MLLFYGKWHFCKREGQNYEGENLKKSILLLICFALSTVGFEKPVSDTSSSDPNAPIKDLDKGKQAYKRFHTTKPNFTLDTAQLKQRYPQLFYDIPLELQDAISCYIPYRFQVEKELHQELENLLYTPFEQRVLVWTALAYEFGLMPYYNQAQGYFYFEQPRDKSDVPPVLKGARRDYRLEDLQRLDAELPQLQQANKDPELIQQKQTKRQEMVKGLSNAYKIHLMPIGQATPVLVKLLQALKTDEELQTLIAAFKVIPRDTFTSSKGKILARIVVYPIMGKEKAQKALDKLYAVFKDVRGLDIQPRYNAKVTDLIWVAQGDSHTKSGRLYKPYFEPPKRVYYRKDFTGIDQDYHLIHPETGKEIV